MYLSSKNCFVLDEIMKSFEVGYRSHIASKIIKKYPNELSFENKVKEIADSIKSSSILNSEKYNGKIINIRNRKTYYYNLISESNDSYLTKQCDKKVPYVSELLDFVYLFYNDCFKNISNGFTTIEEFKDYSSKYHIIRNGLSHPASSKVLLRHAKEIVFFIKKLTINISDDKFWYVSKKDINQQIRKFNDQLREVFLKTHNLNDVSFYHRKLVCRDAELQKLDELIFGKDDTYRKSGSVVIYGYGGVGKTALALEFIYASIKNIIDNKNSINFEFILFYTSKDEVLQFTETTGELYINDIRKQISSFSDFKKKLLFDLGIDSIDELKDKTGLVVIDNIENIPKEKDHFFDFVKQLPRNIQFVFTSRNEEPCEDKLNLKEFNEIEYGLKFIDEYTEINNLEVTLTSDQKTELIKSSKGNTLIIVLTLLLINTGNFFDKIIDDLNIGSSKNNSIIADFMYKNTIKQAINLLESEGHHPINLLKIISLYEVAIDQYSISYLSGIDITSVEHICNFLSSKLVLEKHGESFSLNEFANKYVFIKHLPDRIEKRDLIDKIKKYKRRLDRQLTHLEKTKNNNIVFRNLMEDWKPNNAIDKIAIAETFSLYGIAKEIVRTKEYSKTGELKADFEKNERMTSHPYVKFQKARTYKLLLTNLRSSKIKNEYSEIISNSFEEAIESIDFYYPYIKSTKSYGAVLGMYGLFLSTYSKDQQRALRYLEDAKDAYEQLGIKDKTYYTIINNLSNVYLKIYNIKNDRRYLKELSFIYHDVRKNFNSVKKTGFYANRYLERFRKYTT